MKTLFGTSISLVLVLTGNLALAGERLPVSLEDSSLAPPYVQFMTTGEPADSLLLRVTLCSSPGFRCGIDSYLIIEELYWPPPDPRYSSVNTDEGLFITQEYDDQDWLKSSSRIDGSFLNQQRRKLPPIKSPNGRTGGLGDHWLRPFLFTGWNSPLEFVIEDGRGRFVIKWIGPSQYELVEVTRLN